MKALIQDRYGPLTEVLTVGDTEPPVAGDGEVLVRVEAASIHIGDCHGMRGVPYVMRPIFGLRRPKARIPGTDFAGVVETAPADDTRFKPGDAVYGWGSGAFAEIALAPADQLRLKPPGLSFEQAAATGVSAITGHMAITEVGAVAAGQHVLVVGASGGVGSFAVQVAKALGAEVTGVCSTRHVEMVRSIGADHVIDYTNEDFTTGGPRYDLILDNVGARSFRDTRAALKPDGTLLSNGGPVDGWFGGLDHVVAAMVQSMISKQQGRPFIADSTPERFSAIAELVEAGTVTPVLDEVYPLERAPDAIAHVVEGHAQGTTVISMAGASES